MRTFVPLHFLLKCRYYLFFDRHFVLFCYRINLFYCFGWHTLISLILLFVVCLMVFNATFNNISAISWRSVLLVEDTGVPGENHRPVASHWETLSHNIVHLALISGDRHWLHRNSCKSNYHTITAAPASGWKPSFLQKSVAQLKLEKIQKLKSCIFLWFFFVFLGILQKVDVKYWKRYFPFYVL